MANEEHVYRLLKGVADWNAWRGENPNIRPDLSYDLHSKSDNRKDAAGVARWARLIGAHLNGVDLSGANLTNTLLMNARLHEANFAKADLRWADLRESFLIEANFREADLRHANLSAADLSLADLRGAHLNDAELRGTVFARANLSGAILSGAILYGATFVETNLTRADLTGCHVFGVSAWGLKLDKVEQQNLVITPEDEPKITVDNIEVAQFIYLMLHNEKVRDVIDTITSKAVLILGRFTKKRKAVLDALREALRKRDYLPILFDFDVPARRDITETVSLLARMARFIIADLTDPSSIPKELEAIVPSLAVPVQPLLEGSSRPYAMFKDYWKYDWVLPVYRYRGIEPLLSKLAEKVIAPSEAKVKALAKRRRMIEANLTKPGASND
jgi:hypothetical protein